jgi:hypothetical protein
MATMSAQRLSRRHGEEGKPRRVRTALVAWRAAVAMSAFGVTNLITRRYRTAAIVETEPLIIGTEGILRLENDLVPP